MIISFYRLHNFDMLLAIMAVVAAVLISPIDLFSDSSDSILDRIRVSIPVVCTAISGLASPHLAVPPD